MKRHLLTFLAFLLSIGSAVADVLLYEPFNLTTLPAGWSNTALQGSAVWTFRNAPAFASPSGGNYAVFDDQALGAAVIPNEAALRTPAINCTGRTAVYLRYSHHWFGVEFTHGYVEISNNGGTAWTTLMDYHKQTRGSLAAPQDTVLNITTWAANQANVQIRFRYTDGSQAGRYWYLDDVRVYSDPDVGVSALVAPAYLACAQTYGATQAVTVTVTNYGMNPVSNIPVTCNVTGGTTATLTGTVPGPIAAGASVNYTFAATINMTADAVYNFTAFTSLATDEYNGNNSYTTSRQQRVITYPYTQNFNSGTAGWFATGQVPPNNNNRNFVLGALPYLNGAQGNGDSWYVHTTTSGDGTNIWVESPIFNFAGLSNPQLSFDLKYALHPSDYFHVEYSLNNGTTWTQLGTSADPLWYNTTNWWSGNYATPVNTWTRVQHSLCALAGQTCVKLRFYGRPYYSEPTYTNYHYFSFDNVEIKDGPDAAITAYIDPVDVGCLFATTQQVTVRLFNGGCGNLTNIPLQCDITGAISATLVGTVPGPIAAGASVNYTFPTTINMTGLGVYNFSTTNLLATDVNSNNNTLNTSINVTNLKVTSYPYSEDFNSGANFWTASGDAPPANGGRNFVLGALPYLNGPQGNGDSWYVQTTVSSNGTNIWVESPVFDFTNLTNPQMRFDIKHALHPSDYFHVEYSINGGASWTQLGAGPSPTWYNNTNWWQSSYAAPVNVWTHVEQDLCNLSGEPCVKFRIYGRPYYSEPTYTNYHYFAFDNFVIDAGEPDDLEVAEIILSDAGRCAAFGSNETIAVLIKNNTCRPLYNVPMTIQLDGGAILNEIIAGPIPRFGNYIHTCTNTLNLSVAGTHAITATTLLATDGTAWNNTLTENRFSSTPIAIFPYTENFNSSNGGWVSRTTIPHRYFHWDTLSYLNGAQGNDKSWFVETTQSNDGTNIWVESPIFNFTGISNPQLSFDVKYALHPSDYFHVEYSLNGGTTWTQLGTSTDPNWYNTTNWWSGNYATPVATWTRVQHSLCAVANQPCVKLRFYGRPYYSEPTYTNYHYFAFDNIEIKNGPDVGVIAYVDPVDVGCLFATNQQITVRVYNWSCATQSNVPIRCDVTGTATATLTGTVPGPIPVGGSVNYTFPGTVNMTAVGSYNLNSYTQLVGDVHPWNDALATTINVAGLKVTTFPYFEDFNSGANYWTARGDAPPANGGRNFVLGALPYLNGPQGNGDSWYVHTTVSSDGTNIWVESPVFDFSNLTNPQLSFDIKHALHPSDYFHVEYSINGGASWTQLGTGPSATWYNNTNWWQSSYAAPVNTWTHVEQDLCNLSGEPCVKFRIYGRPYYSEPTYTNYHYFAFDNFAIDAGNPDDIEPVEIILSDAGRCSAFGSNETIAILIKNNTCRPLYNVPMTIQLNGGAVLNEIIAGPIPRFGNYIHTCANTLNLSAAGTHSITATTLLATDGVAANNVRTENRFSSTPIASFPYTQDFNTTNGGWVSRTTIAHRYFHWDTLNYLNGAQGNGKSWLVETTQSNDGTNIWVESPIFNFTGMMNPQMSFDLKYALHPSDYFHVEYSTNGGTTWTQLGTSADPDWYNTTNWWSGNYATPVNTWTRVQHSLCALANQPCVKLRFYGRPYYSEPTYTNYHYFAFDNIEIKEGSDVGITAFIAPVDNGCLFSPTQAVSVRVFNYGCGAISNVPVRCDVSGALTTSLVGTVPGPIAAGGSVVYTFPTTINMTGIGTYNLLAYTQSPTDINSDNDSLTTSITVQQIKISSFPYFQDFNSGAAYWLIKGDAPPANGGRNFVLGQVPYLGGSQGRGDSWYVHTTASGNGTNIWVESPVFDFTNVTNPKLLMDVKHSLHPSDYFHVEYSINGGTTWTQLGTGADPYWYNTPNWWSSSYTTPVSTWTNVEHTLCNLIGQPCVKFRVYGRPYYSEPTYLNYHYFAFDNFHITDTHLDADVNYVIGCFGSNYALEATVVNNNRLCLVSPNLNSIDIVYSVDGGAPVSQTFTGLNIPYGNAGSVMVPNVNVPGPGSVIKVWCANPNGQSDDIFENDTMYAYSSDWPNCNDHCSNATVLGLGTTTASQTDNATIDLDEDPNYSGCGLLTIENTVWYQFTTNSSGDSVEIFFENQDCSPSQNGIQISIDQATTPCDATTYTNLFCSATSDTAAVHWGPTQLPPNTTYYIAIDGFAGSDCDFTIRMRGAVDPLLLLKLSGWSARCAGNGVELAWRAEQEQNNDYYEIERSQDGVQFETIARIESHGGSETNSYFYQDQTPAQGTRYYRLRHVDLNENVFYSTITAVTCEGGNEVLTLYPNPTKGGFALSGTGAAGALLRVELFDALGKKVWEAERALSGDAFNEAFDWRNAAAGTYMVRVQVGDAVTTKRVEVRD